MPAWACWYIGSRVTSRPSKTTLPPSASIRPIVMRKLVVLPAPLGPEQPDDLAAVHVEIDPVDHLAAAVPLFQPADLEQGHRSILLDRRSDPPVVVGRRVRADRLAVAR